MWSTKLSPSANPGDSDDDNNDRDNVKIQSHVLLAFIARKHNAKVKKLFENGILAIYHLPDRFTTIYKSVTGNEHLLQVLVGFHHTMSQEIAYCRFGREQENLKESVLSERKVQKIACYCQK